MARRRKVTRDIAGGIVVYNYGDWRYDDPEWHYDMVDMLVEDELARDARKLCEERGYDYPPKEFWDEWFGKEL